MPQVIEATLDSRGMKFAIVVGRFNSLITARLLDGALDALKRTGCDMDGVDIVRVPGAWEIPLAARTLAAQGRHDAIITLGAVIRGDTPHFDYVAGEAARGIAHVSRQAGIPVAFGVLTANTMEQAADRAGGKSGNKGFDAAMTAVEMAGLMRRLREAGR